MTPRSAAIATLRERIAWQERTGEHAWPTADLGAAALDAALPGGGLATGALHEVLPATPGDFAATLGFGLGVLARILKKRPGHVLWAQPTYHGFTAGTLYPAGLFSFDIDPDRLVHVSVPKPQNMLWTLDEALAHEAFAAVVGLLPENDRAYDFTASRRLSMRAARHGVTALLLAGRSGLETATAAEMRWSVATEPSTPAYRIGQPVPGLGAPRWAIRLIKSRRGGSGHWCVEWNHETLSFRLAAPLADRAPIRLSGLATRQQAIA